MSESNVGPGMVPCRNNCQCDDCTIDRLEARCLKLYNANEKLGERIFELESDREKRVDKWMQLMVEKDERIEKLEDVWDAADRIYNRDMHSQSDEDRLREALKEAE